MSGIDESPSNVRSRPFTFTLTMFPPMAVFKKSRIAASQLRHVAGISAAGLGAPPYAVTSAGF
jgi:hypothetical protein